MNTPDQIALIRTTYAMIRPAAGQAALLFETRLAEAAPGLTLRGELLFAALDRAIVADAPAALAKAMAGGAPVREALLWALDRSLGPGAFTPPVQEAWAGLLEELSEADANPGAAAALAA